MQNCISLFLSKKDFLNDHRSDPEIAPGYTHCEKYRHGFFIGGFKRCGGYFGDDFRAAYSSLLLY